jgi:16S rRNA (cytosine967-C5)-methyltransferase
MSQYPTHRPSSPTRQAPQAEPVYELLDLYARLVGSRAPLDEELSHFFRLRPRLQPAQAAWLVRTSALFVRGRVRLLYRLAWANRDEAAFDPTRPRDVPLTPLEEAACALYLWRREVGKESPRTAKEGTLDSLQQLARVPQSPKVRYQEPGNPAGKLVEFQARWEADPNLARADEAAQLAVRFSLPADIVRRWLDRFGEAEGALLCEAMGTEAPLDLRVNTLVGERDVVREQLLAAGIESSHAPHSPFGLRLAERSRITSLEAWKEGHFEIQDEGSQLVAPALDPKPTWKVLDACAGAGGKTLHLAALMRNRGEIFAHDIEPEKLEQLRLRARRANANNVRVVQPDALRGEFDAVLVDAPCLGLGTLRRNPDLAWRGPLAPRLIEMTEKQRHCLRSYAPLVKPGGLLLYTTCSFEAEETTALLPELEALGFAPAPIAPAFERHGISIPTGSDNTLLLAPHRHQTDGFFLARFIRK